MSRATLLSGLAALIIAAILLVLPFYLKGYGLLLLSKWTIMAIAAIGLNLTLGYAGQISLAQGAFVGIGTYATAILVAAGLPYFLVMLIAILMCFVVGWLLGYPALRVQHHYLAFITLAFSTLMLLVFRNEAWLTGGAIGLTYDARPSVFGFSTQGNRPFYFLCLAVLALVSLGVWGLVRSPWGRAFLALRENPVRALSLGIDTRRYILMAFAIGSALGGLAGALYAPFLGSIDPTSFPVSLSLDLLMMVIVGGSGYFFGPYLGALIAVLLPEWLRFTQGYYLIIYSVMVILLLIYSPSGILGIFSRYMSERKTKIASALRAAAKANLPDEVKS